MTSVWLRFSWRCPSLDLIKEAAPGRTLRNYVAGKPSRKQMSVVTHIESTVCSRTWSEAEHKGQISSVTSAGRKSIITIDSRAPFDDLTVESPECGFKPWPVFRGIARTVKEDILLNPRRPRRRERWERAAGPHLRFSQWSRRMPWRERLRESSAVPGLHYRPRPARNVRQG